MTFSVPIANGRFLVTGAGSLGAKICEALIEQGAGSVRLLDVRPLRQDEVPSGVDVIQVDLRDSEALDLAIKGIDGVFHTAAAVYAPLLREPLLAVNVNIVGLSNLLESCVSAGVRKLIFSSSIVVNGNAEARGTRIVAPFATGTALATYRLYAASKLMGEVLCELYETTYGLASVYMRYTSLYGEYGYAGQAMGYFLECYRQISNGEPPPSAPEEATWMRDWIYAGDAAQANVNAMRSPKTGVGYTVASGCTATMAEAVNLLMDFCGSSLERLPVRQATVTEMAVSDIDATIRDLDWEPTTQLAEGLRRFVERQRSNSGSGSLR